MRITWTGLGCLTLPLLLAIVFVSFYVGFNFFPSDNLAVNMLIVAGVMTLLSPLHWLLGWALNTEMTPSGRQWNSRHTFGGLPVELGFIIQLGFVLFFVFIALTSATSPAFGCLTFIGVLVVLAVGIPLLTKARRRRLNRNINAQRPVQDGKNDV